MLLRLLRSLKVVEVVEVVEVDERLFVSYIFRKVWISSFTLSSLN